MRSVFMIVSLLLTLAIVGVLVKKQLTSIPSVSPAMPGLTPQPQSPSDIQQQYKQALDAAMQPAKRDADEK